MTSYKVLCLNEAVVVLMIVLKFYTVNRNRDLDPIYLYRVQLMDSGKGHVRVRDMRRGEVRSSIYVQFIS